MCSVFEEHKNRVLKISLLSLFCLDIQTKSYEKDSGASLLICYIEMNIYTGSQNSSEVNSSASEIAIFVCRTEKYNRLILPFYSKWIFLIQRCFHSAFDSVRCL